MPGVPGSPGGPGKPGPPGQGGAPGIPGRNGKPVNYYLHINKSQQFQLCFKTLNSSITGSRI